MKILTNHRYALITGIVLAAGAVLLPCTALLRAGFRIQTTCRSRAGCTSWPACSGSASSITSTPYRSRPGGRRRRQRWSRWRRHRQVRRAARAVLVPLGRARHLGRRRMAARTNASCRHSRSATRTARTTTRPWSSASAPGSAPSCCLNVWGIIWPNQKKILGIKPATDEEKAKARKAALYASRTNFILSIPDVVVHGGRFARPADLIARFDRAGRQRRHRAAGHCRAG